MNFIFRSPNFPLVYYKFVKSLKEKGINVLGIGDEAYDSLHEELKKNLTEYVCVHDMNNFNDVLNATLYLKEKYGQIDYFESNNEYWLMQDAEIREKAGILNGFLPQEMSKIKFKSEMKKYFNKAGVKTCRYLLSKDRKEIYDFTCKVGYPLFAKPNNGVGAAHTFKINNDIDLENFIKQSQNEEYIIEEYINGTIITFDGICDDDSNVIISFNETFPLPVADVVNNDLDDYYYANVDMNPNFLEIGKKVIKSFGIKKRCFHIEFFKLNEGKEGLGKKGDIVGLEVNMRPPGGYTPEILSYALNKSFYDVYADIIVNNKSNINEKDDHYISISVARKNRFSYIHTNEEIIKKYKNNLMDYGEYPKSISDAMGDAYYFGKFTNLVEALDFQQYIQAKY